MICLPPLNEKKLLVNGYQELIGNPFFLSEYLMPGKTFVQFMTYGGSGLGRTMSHVRSLCPNANVEQGLAIRGAAIDSFREKVFEWLQNLDMV